LNPERVGRDGFLRLRFERRGCSTFLAQSRFTLPLQALTPARDPTTERVPDAPQPDGGVLGGDHLATEIIQEPCTHVCLANAVGDGAFIETAVGPAVLENR